MRRELAEACHALALRDAMLRRVIRGAGPCGLPARRPPATHFAALAEAILYQQLAGRAAAAIHARFVALFDGAGVTPEGVLGLPERELRAAGLSGSKAASIRDLAAKVLDRTVRLDRAARLADDDVVSELVQVRGIGRWTAEMFLVFQLGRLDVWPVDDYGVRKGYARLHGLVEPPHPRELDALGERYRPYRSVAAWYCWQTADTQLMG